MNLRSQSNLTHSNGSTHKKRKALYVLSYRHFDEIYGPETRSQIAAQVAIPNLVVTKETYEDSDQTWPEVEMILSGWGTLVMDETFLSRFPELKIVFYGSGSAKHLLTNAFWERGVRITSALSANAVPVAEYTCSQIVQTLKRGFQSALYIKKEKKFPEYYTPQGTFQTTVGLLSLGTIGRMVAERLSRFDFNVVAYDPFITQEQARRLNVTLMSLEEVMAKADVVSCHTPWLPSTERLVRGYHFEVLKPNATFINTARGAIVAEDEMIEVLQKRPDITAILDVTHPEPPIEGSPLYTLDNVILTPHIAGSRGNECRRMGQYMLEELNRYLNGLPLLYELSETQVAIMA